MTTKKTTAKEAKEVKVPLLKVATHTAYAIKIVAKDGPKLLADAFGTPILFRNDEVARAVQAPEGVTYKVILVDVTEIYEA